MPETSALSQIVLHPVSATLNDEDINLSAEKVVMAEHIIAVSECADSLRFHSTPSISPLQTRLLSRSTGWLPSAGQQVESSDEEETEMAEMMAEGKKLRQLAENCAQQSDEYQISSSPPAHRFTAKMALLIGTGLLAGVVGSVAWQRARATERSNNSTELYRSEVPPPLQLHDNQMAYRSADYYASENVDRGEPLPQPAARASPRKTTTSKPSEHDDVKKIAISDLICYETVGAGRMAHRRIAPCKIGRAHV